MSFGEHATDVRVHGHQIEVKGDFTGHGWGGGWHGKRARASRSNKCIVSKCLDENVFLFDVNKILLLV